MSTDALIIGAGPAGMTAAIRLRRAGLSATVVDDAPAPGGQIWRAAEGNVALAAKLGASYKAGQEVIRQFRACGADYRPGTELWRLDEGWHGFIKSGAHTECIESRTVLLATGAIERSAPFPGWTLPGVMTVGGAQTLLKNAGQIPDAPVWIAGSGPLVLLYAAQLLDLGGSIAGWLDTSPKRNVRRTASTMIQHAIALLHSTPALAKGAYWRLRLVLARIPIIQVRSIAAKGRECLEVISYTMEDGRTIEVPARLLLIHEGVVPNIQASMALGCAHTWNDAQAAFTPTLDAYGLTSRSGLYVAGDSGGILGASAAERTGTLSALGILATSGRLSPAAAAAEARPLWDALRREQGLRAFLDALYRPRDEIFSPSDETIICRCEELTAGQIREAAAASGSGPNQVKALTRVGMGPCQGRQCGLTLSHLIAECQGRTVESVGYFNVRQPLKPVTLGELSRLRRRLRPPSRQSPMECCERDLRREDQEGD